MTEDARPGRHPLCTCRPITYGGPTPDRSKCKGGTIAHPVLTESDLRELVEGLRK